MGLFSSFLNNFFYFLITEIIIQESKLQWQSMQGYNTRLIEINRSSQFVFLNDYFMVDRLFLILTWKQLPF